MNNESFFKHELAVCESSHIGQRTRIYCFAHVLPGAKIGSDCNICDGVFVENDVVVGDRVTVKCGVQLWDGITIEDDVFIGPNATFTNDRFPRSKAYPSEFLKTIIRQGASIGGNATILPGLEIGSGAMIGAGAVVTRSVPSNAIAVGNPARIIGYVNARSANEPKEGALHSPTNNKNLNNIGVRGAQLCNFPWIKDLRGDLTVGEFATDFPFAPSRYFLVFSVPSREIRGEHAHRQCEQILICVHGQCSVLVDDGVNRREIVLDNPTVGLHISPMVWGTQWKYSSDAVLLVFASQAYDPNDYIRDYSVFLRELDLKR